MQIRQNVAPNTQRFIIEIEFTCRVKSKLHELLHKDQDFTKEDMEELNPLDKISIANALRYIKNPVQCCKHVHLLIKELNLIIPQLQEENGNAGVLYHSETWDLMARRWGKLEKDFCVKNSNKFDIYERLLVFINNSPFSPSGSVLQMNLRLKLKTIE